MSDGGLAAALVAAYPNVIIEKLCYGAMGALAIYEHLITFDSEVRLVWRRKVTGATVLFMLNKYLLLLRFLIVLTSYDITTTEVSDSNLRPARCSDLTLDRCRATVLAGDFFQTAPHLIWAAFAALRVYALTDHLWWLAAIIFLVSSVPVATNTYAYSITSIESFIPPFNCISSLSMSEELYLALLILTRASVVLGDVLVIGVTWYKTYNTWKTAASVAMKASFSTMLLRDGTVYFLCILTLNVLHLAFSLTGLFVQTLVIFQDPLISILVGRFILNLRDLDRAASPSTATSNAAAEKWNANASMSLNFAAFDSSPAAEDQGPAPAPAPARGRLARFVAPLGAPLDHARGDEDEYEVEEVYLDGYDGDAQVGGGATKTGVAHVAIAIGEAGSEGRGSSSSWTRTSGERRSDERMA
ncbi:hypothetical protein C8Q76DRAFT_800315 [Earliella scabrosa]|nr:hypothetical protein C8Q76DRAFT_800315 [Earliella scabrosa]